MADILRPPSPSDSPGKSRTNAFALTFRDYIDGRAQVVRFFALLDALFLLSAISWLVSDTNNHIQQLGLVLQILGVSALVPYVISRGNAVLPSNETGVAIDPVMEEPTDELELASDGDDFRYYQIQNLSLLIGNLIVAIFYMILMAEAFLVPLSQISTEEILSRGLLGLIGFAWLNLFMQLQIFYIYRARVPQMLLALFFIIDLAVSVVGVFIAGLIEIFIHWIPQGVKYTYGNGYRRVLLVFTLPCLIMGLVFELISTF